MKKLFLMLMAVLVTSCSSQQAETEPTALQLGPPMRYLAWLEGDFQSGYQADKKKAQARLQRFMNKPPSPEQTDDYLEYLSLLDALGRTKEAGKLLRRYVADNPAETRGVFLLAIHSLRVKKRPLAEYFFRKLEKDPRFPWRSLLFNNLGMLALKDGKRNAALVFFEKATKEKPPIAAPYVNLGTLYLQSRSYEQAEKKFRMATELDPDFEDGFLGLGIALEGVGKYEQAHQVYGGFIDKHPDAMSVLYNDSILLGKRLNRPRLAAEQLLRYIQRGGKESAKAQKFIQSWR